MLRRSVLCVAVLGLALALAGCGGGNDASAPVKPSAEAAAAAVPALGRSPARTDETVVQGEASPRTHGPFAFDGRYLVRFEQYAPEDPRLDFASQTPFTAALTRRQGDARGAVELFETAARSGRIEVALHGRYYVDVSFGDYPYVVRLTPRDP